MDKTFISVRVNDTRTVCFCYMDYYFFRFTLDKTWCGKTVNERKGKIVKVGDPIFVLKMVTSCVEAAASGLKESEVYVRNL